MHATLYVTLLLWNLSNATCFSVVKLSLWIRMLLSPFYHQYLHIVYCASIFPWQVTKRSRRPRSPHAAWPPCTVHRLVQVASNRDPQANLHGYRIWHMEQCGKPTWFQLISIDFHGFRRINRSEFDRIWEGVGYVSLCKTFEKPSGTTRNPQKPTKESPGTEDIPFTLVRTAFLVESVDRDLRIPVHDPGPLQCVLLARPSVPQALALGSVLPRCDV